MSRKRFCTPADSSGIKRKPNDISDKTGHLAQLTRIVCAVLLVVDDYGAGSVIEYVFFLVLIGPAAVLREGPSINRHLIDVLPIDVVRHIQSGIVFAFHPQDIFD